MSARSRLALHALLVLVVLAVVGAPLSTAVGDASAAQTTATDASAVPAEHTTINLQLDANGDATWVITTQLNVTDEGDREAFRDIAGQHERGQRETPWLDEVTAAKDAAEDVTGRSMNITDVERSSNAENTSISLRFTWTDFARADGDQLVADDTFNTTRGTWLDGITENQTLLIELPAGSTLQHAPRGAAIQQGHVRWDGPQQFEPGYMRIAYTVEDDPSPTTSSPGTGSGDDLLLGGFFVLGIGAVVVGAYVLSRRGGGVLPVSDDDGGDGPTAPSENRASPGASGAVSAQSATTGTVEPAVDEPDDEIDEELLSDEERVERLLEKNGGRMKQANIVRETDWSNAKVSQLLSAMEEEGHINKLRIGRENLISFPDEDITDLDKE